MAETYDVVIIGGGPGEIELMKHLHQMVYFLHELLKFQFDLIDLVNLL